MRIECTYIKYGRNFCCQTFPSFISLYLSNGTCLLLLPRFCYAEILGLALFVLWLRWSLCQSVLIVTAVLPHAHTDLLIFFLSEYSLMDWYLCLSEMFARSLWPDVHMSTKKKTRADHIVFVSLVLVTLDSSSQPCVVFLSVCLSPSHAFNWNAITNTCPHIITLLSPSASCFQLSRLYTRHIG